MQKNPTLYLVLIGLALFLTGCLDSTYDIPIEQRGFENYPLPSERPTIETNPIIDPVGDPTDEPTTPVDEPTDTATEIEAQSGRITITDGQLLPLLDPSLNGDVKAKLVFTQSNYARPGEEPKSGIVGVSLTNTSEMGPFFVSDASQAMVGKAGKKETWGLRNAQGSVVNPFIVTEFKGFNSGQKESFIEVGNIASENNQGIKGTELNDDPFFIPFAIRLDFTGKSRQTFLFNGEKFTLFLKSNNGIPFDTSMTVKNGYAVNGRDWRLKTGTMAASSTGKEPGASDTSTILLTVQEVFTDQSFKRGDVFTVDGVTYKVMGWSGTTSIMVSTDMTAELFIGDIADTTSAKSAAKAIFNPHTTSYSTNALYGRLFLSENSVFEVSKSLSNPKIEWSQPKIKLYTLKNPLKKTYYAAKYNPANKTFWFVLEDNQTRQSKNGQISLISTVLQDATTKQKVEEKSYYHPFDESFDSTVAQQNGKEVIAKIYVGELQLNTVGNYLATPTRVEVSIDTKTGRVLPTNSVAYVTAMGQPSWILPLAPAGYRQSLTTFFTDGGNPIQLDATSGVAKITTLDTTKTVSWGVQPNGENETIMTSTPYVALDGKKFTTKRTGLDKWELNAVVKVDTTRVGDKFVVIPANEFKYDVSFGYLEPDTCMRLLGNNYKVVSVNKNPPRSITIDTRVPCNPST